MVTKTVQEALDAVLAPLAPLPSEVVDVVAALGRVLAQDVTAELPLPMWDNSAMDGYAVDAAGMRAGVTLPVSMTVAAGASVTTLAPGTAARIMTGAPVPKGAVAVLMREQTDESDPQQVVLKRAPTEGEAIRRRGEDVEAGAVVLRAGHCVRAADVGMMCALGRARVQVRRAPVVAILSTGDELCEVGGQPQPGQIMNSNAWMLAALVKQAGAVPRVLATARDTREDLVGKLQGAAGADVLLTSGGVSAGDFDFVVQALADVGAQLDFWKVALRPGKPLAVGSMGNTRVFGLPGNPVSSFVTFVLFVAPALRALLGQSTPGHRQMQAVLQADLAKKGGMTLCVRSNLAWGPSGQVHALPRTQQSSGALTSISGADALVVLGHDSNGARKGDVVDVLLLDDGWMRSTAWG